MHAFTVHPQKKTPPAEPEETPRRRWRRWAALVLLLLGVGGLAWAVRPDPHLSRAQALQKEFFSPAAKSLSPEERKARFAEYREHVKHLTDDQKWELAAPVREKQQAELDRYFALAPKDRVKYLDEKIDRSETMRKEWEKKAAQSKSARPKGGAGFAAGGPKGGGPKRGPAPSAEEKEKRRRQFLDRTTPEERAKMDKFRKDMADRRKQRGLPTRT